MSSTLSKPAAEACVGVKAAEAATAAAEAALADMPEGGELVIIDNASGDGSAGVLANAIAQRGWDAQNRVRLILSDVNGGFGAGNNLGFKAGMSDGRRPDYFYVLNSDAFPDQGCLPALIKHLETTPYLEVSSVGTGCCGQAG